MQIRRSNSIKVDVFGLLAVAALVCAAGCGSGGYSGPTGTVSGSVKLGDKPVPDGSAVTFISDDGHTATGNVSGDGQYQLSTISGTNQQDSIPVGKYRVCVNPAASTQAVSDADYEKQMQESANASGAGAAPAPPSAIPAKYHTTTTSELAFEVKEGPNTIDIVLK